MRIDEITIQSLKHFIAQVRCVVDGVGVAIVKVCIRCDSLSGARYVLAKTYGLKNVLSLHQAFNEDFVGEELAKPLSARFLRFLASADVFNETEYVIRGAGLNQLFGFLSVVSFSNIVDDSVSL